MKLDMTPSPKAEKSGLAAVAKVQKVGNGGWGIGGSDPSLTAAIKSLGKQHKGYPSRG